ATDSFRLAERTAKKGGSSSGEGEFLIPLKHATELVYVLERSPSENVKIHASDSQLVVVADSTRFAARVVDGIFPNYAEIIPKQFTTEATILKNDFAEMLRKARVFSGNDQHVGLHVYPKKKIFSATAQSPDVGETSDSIDAAVSGEDIDINFHIGYLADCVPAIDSDSITLGFSGPNRPLVIRGASDPGFTYLVMPLNR
ncbi:MAG: DNA polymerase III subunit beta, partial [Patescibacteria group bacterium]